MQRKCKLFGIPPLKTIPGLLVALSGHVKLHSRNILSVDNVEIPLSRILFSPGSITQAVDYESKQANRKTQGAIWLPQ